MMKFRNSAMLCQTHLTHKSRFIRHQSVLYNQRTYTVKQYSHKVSEIRSMKGPLRQLINRSNAICLINSMTHRVMRQMRVWNSYSVPKWVCGMESCCGVHQQTRFKKGRRCNKRKFSLSEPFANALTSYPKKSATNLYACCKISLLNDRLIIIFEKPIIIE